jgi:hypothetical protein
MSDDQGGSAGGAGSQSPRTRSIRKGSVAWVAAIVLVALLVVYSLGGSASPSTSSFTSTTSTSYDVGAASVVSAAAQQSPSGYNATSAGGLRASYPGEESGAYAILSEPQSAANMTALVFTSADSAGSYYSSYTSHVRGLAGYTDVSADLAAYTQYGSCYAYGEDVDGIAVLNGVCTDGNVFLQVHLSSSASFQQLEGDLSGLMGALYHSLG